MRTLRKLEKLQQYLVEEEARGDPRTIGYLREQRRHTVLDLLENPGYASEAQLRRLQKDASDILSDAALETYLAGRWQHHLALLRVETYLHIASIASLALACILVFGRLTAVLPAALTTAIGLLWLALTYAELIWSGSLAATVRRLFVPSQMVGGITAREQLRLAIHGMRFWRRPVAWLVVLLLARPLTVTRHSSTAPAIH